jgi:hypothetical protein
MSEPYDNERTTEVDITFEHPFVLSSIIAPFHAGTYRLITDEERIEGLSFTAFRKVAVRLEIPSMEERVGNWQTLLVSQTEIDAAIENDRRLSREKI